MAGGEQLSNAGDDGSEMHWACDRHPRMRWRTRNLLVQGLRKTGLREKIGAIFGAHSLVARRRRLMPDGHFVSCGSRPCLPPGHSGSGKPKADHGPLAKRWSAGRFCLGCVLKCAVHFSVSPKSVPKTR